MPLRYLFIYLNFIGVGLTYNVCVSGVQRGVFVRRTQRAHRHSWKEEGGRGFSSLKTPKILETSRSQERGMEQCLLKEPILPIP